MDTGTAEKEERGGGSQVEGEGNRGRSKTPTRRHFKCAAKERLQFVPLQPQTTKGVARGGRVDRGRGAELEEAVRQYGRGR